MRRTLFSPLIQRRILSRFNSSGAGGDILEDKMLQRSFSGIGPRLSSVFNILINEKKYDEFTELYNKNVLPGNALYAMKVFSDLQHPLIKKYNFNPTEFLEGATEAFKQIHSAMASMEFSNFANGVVKQSDKADLLKSSLSPYLYDVCGKAAKFISNSDTSLVMTNLSVNKSVLAHVETFINVDLYKENKKLVEELFAKLAKDDTLSPPSNQPNVGHAEIVSESDLDKVKDAVLNNMEIEPLDTGYVDGSVIVRADVYYEADESYVDSKDSDKKVTRTAKNIWTFEGCISGQTELDWQVVAFDGLGSDTRTHMPVKLVKKSESVDK